MTLKSTDFEKMSIPVKEFTDSPEDFLKNNDKNTVIETIVALSENQSDFCDFLVLLAKCMKVYPNCWHYVRTRFCSDLPPFQVCNQEMIERCSNFLHSLVEIL